MTAMTLEEIIQYPLRAYNDIKIHKVLLDGIITFKIIGETGNRDSYDMWRDYEDCMKSIKTIYSVIQDQYKVEETTFTKKLVITVNAKVPITQRVTRPSMLRLLNEL